MSDNILLTDTNSEPFVLVKRKTLRKKISSGHKNKKDLNVESFKNKLIPKIENRKEE